MSGSVADVAFGGENLVVLTSGLQPFQIHELSGVELGS
jgi:hypothetical protein